MSARSSGRFEDLGVVEEAEDEGPEPLAVGDLHGQHDRAVRPALLDRIGADVAGGPRGLAGVDQQPGGEGLVASHLPRRRLGAHVGRALERARLTGDLDIGLHPVEPEHALLAGVVVVAGEVPVAVAEREPPGVDPAGLAAVGEPDPPAGRDGGEDRRQVGGARQGGHGRRRPLLGQLASQLPERLDPAGALQAHGGGGQVQGGQLVGGQARVLQVVRLLGNPVADHPGLGHLVDRLDHDGDAEVAQGLLVPFERPAEGAVILGVPGQAVAQLLGGQRPLGMQQGGDQVDQPLQPVHASDATGPASVDFILR